MIRFYIKNMIRINQKTMLEGYKDTNKKKEIIKIALILNKKVRKIYAFLNNIWYNNIKKCWISKIIIIINKSNHSYIDSKRPIITSMKLILIFNGRYPFSINIHKYKRKIYWYNDKDDGYIYLLWKLFIIYDYDIKLNTIKSWYNPFV